MTQIKISTISNLIHTNLNDNYNTREKKHIVDKYLTIKYNVSNTDIILDKQISWNTLQLNKLNRDIHKLNKGIPIQYVIKKEFFYNYIFHVDSGVLIPRPETEELVSIVIQKEKRRERLKILDVGCGSGCICITLKKELLNSEVTAIDFSSKALNISKKNAKLLNANISFHCRNIFQYQTKTKFDIIISNPPYILEQNKDLIDKSVLKFEPHKALFVENDALLYYKKILNFASTHLNKRGRIYFEINSLYKKDFAKYLYDNFSHIQFKFLKDLQGYDRFLFLKF